MKIRFFSDYDGSERLLERFKSNYDVYDNDLEFTTNNDYEYAVVFNNTQEIINSSSKIITIIQEPSWNYSYVNKRFLVNSNYLIIHDPALFEKTHQIKLGGTVIESPSFMFYHDPIERKSFEGSEFINKQKKISMIMSGTYSSNGNYNQRLNLLHQILQSDLDIDIYGRKLDISDQRFKGMLEYKYIGLIPYEYSIAIENSNENNYITEKFIDCVLCNTIPIYNGAPNIKDVYDHHFFRTIDLNSDNIVEDIRNIIAVPAHGCLVNKNIYLNDFNLYTKLKQLILK